MEMMDEQPRWGNIFILCTGRCGSTTFIKALNHCTNYTAGHETRTARAGRTRFAYPANHIEADNRLSWLLGRLDRYYGDNAFYVHLRRNRQRVAESFVKRSDRGIMAAYRDAILMPRGKTVRTEQDMDFAIDYIDTVNTNIAMFLRDKSAKMIFQLEHWEQHFPEFWKKIGAEGDFQAAIGEFGVLHNASRNA